MKERKKKEAIRKKSWVNMVENYVLMYVNGKMRLETIPEMRGEGIKENDGRGWIQL
jgi:hypothetical protein